MLQELFGPSKEQIWSQLAASLNGRFTPGGWFGSDVVQARTGDWIVTLDTVSENRTTYTRLRAPFVNRDGFRFTVYRSGLFTEIGKLFGLQDIEIGAPYFDPEFIIQSNYPPKIVALLTSVRIRQLITVQPQVYFTVQRDGSWSGIYFPPGVDQLLFKVQGGLNLEQLRLLYDLFGETLNYLCHLDSAYKDDLSLHLEMLAGPGGRIMSGDSMLWDGELARVRAAAALTGWHDPRVTAAMLQSLPSAELELRVQILRALGATADPGCAPYLVPYLGDPEQPPGSAPGWMPAREAAAEGLSALGYGSLPAAFGAVLRGQTDRLSLMEEGWRPLFIQALAGALRGVHLAEVAGAAAALAEWQVREALPDLRQSLRRLRGEESEARVAVEKAIKSLEKLNTLPRPADAPPATAQELPVPASRPAEPDLS